MSNTELVKLFHGIDVALQPSAPQAEKTTEDSISNGDSAREDDDDDDDAVAAHMSPLPPVLTSPLLVSFAPNLRYPTHITLSATYLGDAGTAAFFRVLPMLRWLRMVDARGVGAGPRSLDALNGALMAYLVEGCEEAPALRVTHGDDDGETDAMGICSNGVADTHPLAGRLPALELIDLRGNDAVFTLSVEKLLAVLLRRHAALLQWCAKQGERNAEADLLPALEVRVDAANLLGTTAHALLAWNAAAADTKRRRQIAAGERRWQEQLRVFTVQRDISESCASPSSSSAAAAAAVVQPTGEHVVFRLPLQGEEEGGEEKGRVAAAGSAMRAANQLRGSINANMHAFLCASCMLAPPPPPSPAAGAVPPTPPSSPLLFAAQGARAALQACVDFGADALECLFYSNAVTWYYARTHAQHPKSASSDAFSDLLKQDNVQLLEAQRNISALLHSFELCPTLEQELLASQVAGGVVVERHLRRLRELHKASANATGTATLHPSPGPDEFHEMVQLYDRVVAALVTSHFSARHVPSMQAHEQFIERVTQHVLQHLVSGADDVERLAARVRRLRDNDLSGTAADVQDIPTQVIEGGSDPKSRETRRLLPPVMATCFYRLQDHRKAEVAWRQTYAGTSAAVADAAARTCVTMSDVPEVMQAFHCCRCAAPSPAEAVVAPWETREGGFPAPCATCSYRALTSVQDALRDAVNSEEGNSDGELLYRWTMLEPVRDALPRELRMFFLDMVIRQRSRREGGCAYVPPLVPLPNHTDESTLEERWSMAAWLACSHDHKSHWVEVLRVFGQWYRLRALESQGQPELEKLLSLST